MMQELGVGFLELGPLDVSPRATSPMTNPRRLRRMHGLATSRARGAPGIDGVLDELSDLRVPVGVQLRDDQAVETIKAARDRVDFFTLGTRVARSKSLLREARCATDRPMLLRVFSGWDRRLIDHAVENACTTGIDSVVVVAGAEYPGLEGGEIVWNGALPRALSVVSRVSERMPTGLAGGILTPADAVAAMDAGAGLLFLTDGLVFAGPGLPKRINRLFVATVSRQSIGDEAGPVFHAGNSLLGGNGAGGRDLAPPPTAAMAGSEMPKSSSMPGSAAAGTILLASVSIATIVLGLAYILVAATLVLLPQETNYLGMGVPELCDIDECRLVDFMVHGKASKGGVIVAVGIMFGWLAAGPWRRREPWAWWTLCLGGIAFFGSSLSFLAYGYLDTWHIALAAGLAVCWFVGLGLARPDFTRGGGPVAAFRAPPARAWLWSPGGRGRLMVAMLASGLIAAGLSILAIAGSDVFVPQDFGFMRFNADGVATINERLIPLMAHDRAGFGGGMLTLGIMFAATAWMGIRRNALGAWWALGLAGACLMLPTLTVHLAIGYNDFFHLSPVYGGVVLLAIALITLLKMMSTGSYEAAELPDV